MAPDFYENFLSSGRVGELQTDAKADMGPSVGSDEVRYTQASTSPCARGLAVKSLKLTLESY